MLFHSFAFLIFFPVAVAAYFLMPHRFRWAFLLAASYYFYMAWEPKYALLLMVSTVVDYAAALLIGRAQSKKKRRAYLGLSLASNLGLLFFFKYANFFIDTVEGVFSRFVPAFDAPSLSILLPVGISFYTFQTLSYTIDVYRGVRPPEKHFGIFALYVSFFPQLVAGPIERSTTLLPQFFRKVSFDYARVTDGLKLMLWGFFKKLVIADRAAILVDQVYAAPEQFSGGMLLLSTYLFAFQIYCDFSGYSDIAIGAAKVMGYDLMDNFKRPYFSKSIAEFWRRWHISLMSWFKDYLYIPLGGSRVSLPRWVLNMSIVFFVSGLWHGANWTFVAWGLLHAGYILFGKATASIRSAMHARFGLSARLTLQKYIRVFITFHLVLVSWIFFRAQSIGDGWHIVTHLFSGWAIDFSGVLRFSHFDLLMLGLSIGFMEAVHLLERHKNMRHFLSQKPLALRWSVYSALLWWILLYGSFTEQAFIYFQF